MKPLAAPRYAVVREVPSSYAACLRVEREPPIDVAAAQREHAGYVAALGELGVEVRVLAADPACPDCCFVEDTAVITGAHALATRPGAESRRAEVADVAAVLADRVEVHPMRAPATLDGGDVLRVADCLFVGLSERTNAAGVAELARVAALDGLRTVPVAVHGGLHLKSACTLASARLLVYDARLLGDADLAAFRDLGVACLAADEPAGANVLALGDAVLVSAAAPRTAARLAREGLRVKSVAVFEMHKGDGALTCLSLRFPQTDAYCA